MSGKAKLIIFYCYWAIISLLLICHLYNNGSDYKKQCNLVKGKVVDQVNSIEAGLRHSNHIIRPQIEFPVGDTTYLFVDHSTKLNIGETPKVLYCSADPSIARVYNFWYWIDVRIVLLYVLISGSIWALFDALTTKYNNKPVLLPSECDNL